MEWEEKQSYPSTPLPPPPGSDEVDWQFVLPIRINDVLLWGLLDTGASVSILPKPVAGSLDIDTDSPAQEGEYAIASIIKVPYFTRDLDVEIMEPDKKVMEEGHLKYYGDDAEAAFELSGIRFQVSKMSFPEVADHLDAKPPISLQRDTLGFAILGVRGLLEELSITTVGKNAVTVGKLDLDV